MHNPKTTITGYAVLLGALVTLVSHLLAGAIGASDITAVLAALSGIGLITASDGGH